ncbi:7604_t:CDS:1 [Acaulospora colombiana]|uniref:7604_t:CDS:1 n=1 Tax=Acaulospora colombiana TaxID=27376 RepID=A0ACA9LM85_9GLOM|nr:7604_t:CDS:1 [Acaulospora colombiana]
MPKACEIEFDEFVNRSEEKIGTKTPNGFFVYRRIFTKEVSRLRLDHKLNMTNVSKMASWKWRNEDVKVREEYRQVASSIIGTKIKNRERELPKIFYKKFIPYVPREPLPPPVDINQQGVIDEELARGLYEWYSRDNIFEEFFGNFQ